MGNSNGFPLIRRRGVALIFRFASAQLFGGFLAEHRHRSSSSFAVVSTPNAPLPPTSTAMASRILPASIARRALSCPKSTRISALRSLTHTAPYSPRSSWDSYRPARCIAGQRRPISSTARSRFAEVDDAFDPRKQERESDEVDDHDTQRRFEYLKTTDDEDMAGWFGHAKKTVSKCSLSSQEVVA